ncbi:hypothetical protein AB6A40_010971, partial [Gnathostoma spinigerum]
NNAGIIGNSFFDDFLEIDDFLEVLKVNTFGAIRVTHIFKPLIKRSRGRIIGMTSICARVPVPGFAPYTVSKHATAAYFDCLRKDGAGRSMINY